MTADLLEFATQLDPNVWTQDREVASSVCSQLKSLQSKVNAALVQSEQNPDMDLTSLLEMSTKLTRLQELTARALKGDRAAALQISQLNNPNAKAEVSEQPVEEAVKPRPKQTPSKEPDYITSRIEVLKKDNFQLKRENLDLRAKLMTLESIASGKPISFPDFTAAKSQKKQKLDFAFGEAGLTLLLKNSPPINGGAARNVREEQKKLAADSKELDMQDCYKDCILISNGCLYEDENLKITMVRSVEEKQKIATMKLNLFNKAKNKAVEVKQFVPAHYNKSGNLPVL
eukprot:TRINITY_DN4708_c0_g1_i1.p1 TRINITY_DN4708_c0_g1~~TRINITY_DN4708_c0_g1_i1.p1  ORF type:complete len:287 (-),score=66.59 TRINITY_DN4708_c0_g1_i1:696-1556(-)